MKKILVLLFVVISSIFVACQNDQSLKSINTTAENIAIKGFDAVSYFGEGASVGNPQYAFIWNGAKWLFSSSENLEKFKINPEKYAPQFEGLCSWSVSQGTKAEGDPNVWKVVDGKLYLNYNDGVKKRWEADQENLIREGEKKWQELKNKKSS